MNNVTTFNEEFVDAVRAQFPGVEVQHCDFMKLNQTHGYVFRFPNGMRASVQFGPATYSTHYDRATDFLHAARGLPIPITYTENATTAEIAGKDTKGEFVDFGWGDDVNGYQSPSDVLEWLKQVAS